MRLLLELLEHAATGQETARCLAPFWAESASALWKGN